MNKKFHLGLTMAGAVSAGAYTGGVLDYLIQTLDAWYNAKAASDATVPTHQLSIDIISGASAGGITGAMAALVLHMQDRNPVTPDKRSDEEYLKKNIFYNAWVNLKQDDMLPNLLSHSDIEADDKVVSLLNSKFIEDIARETIINVPENTEAPPPYVSKQMELILTLSNLDGFTYKLKFPSEGASTHTMKQHRDYAFFRLGDQYSEGRIPLNLQRKNQGLQELVQAAPATGAFPVGLAYRKFVRKQKYILDNPDLVVYKEGVTTIEGVSWENREQDYVTYNVDGGMLNNEPFDLTMKLMARAAGAGNNDAEELEKQEHQFDGTIIMVDPFPSDDSIVADQPYIQESNLESISTSKSEKKFKSFPYNLIQVIGRIYNCMRGELLFKGEEIVKAFSREDFSRFMIAPRRRNASGTTFNGSVAIACGALGGFAGFFDKTFRKHDFYLGRANCQSFLRKYFRVRLENGVPVNPLFRDGYSKEAIEYFKFQDPLEQASLKDPATATWYVPIIPDVYIKQSKFDETPLPYPAYDMSKLDNHKKLMLKRFKRVALSLNSSWWYRPAIGIAFFFFGNKLYRQLRETIEKQFTDWKLV